MATAKSRLQLDDGEQHQVRILLERNRFRTEALARTEEAKATLEATGALAEGNPTHRLLVYVDDMEKALINLELDAEDVFGDDLKRTGGRMFAGFTAGTGRENASHMITSWRFYEVGAIREDKEEEWSSWLGSFFGLGGTE